MSSNRLTSLNVLRAIAALAVCFYHFDRNGFSHVAWFSSIANYGYLGVDIFFVISGFVIPLALERVHPKLAMA